MNAIPTVTVWLQLLGFLAVEIALAVGVAVFLLQFTASASWRLAVWHVCLASLLALMLVELTGAARSAAGWLVTKTGVPKGVNR